MNRNNLYVQILQFGTGKESFTFEQLRDKLQLNRKQCAVIARQVEKGQLFCCSDGNVQGYSHKHRSSENTGDRYLFSLTVEDEFRLLEYQELQEARESSRKAQEASAKSSRLAHRAFWISIVALILSTIFNIISNFSTFSTWF